MRTMTRHLQAACLLLGLVLAAACTTAPYTGRSQLILVSPEQAESMGDQAADQILKESRLSTDQAKVQKVEEVGRNIAQAADRPDFEWEFHTIEAPDTANAFALPGGKIFGYTGIFRYADTPAELATVMSHEVAHVLVRHGSERMSMELITSLGEEAARSALGLESPVAMQAFEKAYGAATNVGVILPYSRKQELEADQVGLILMARAGYDPRAAVTFWKKMMQASGEKPPAFLSTHPTEEQRIREIEAFLPQALEQYRQ